VHEAFYAELSDPLVIRLLQQDTENSQIGAPGVLKHGPDRFCVIDQNELGVGIICCGSILLLLDHSHATLDKSLGLFLKQVLLSLE